MASPTTTPRQFATYAASSKPILKLPHPYLTAYFVEKITDGSAYQLAPGQLEPGSNQPPQPLHNSAVNFSEPQDLKSSDRPSDCNNTPWARARRNPSVTVTWTDTTQPPTIGQLWLLTYAVFTIRPNEEAFRLTTPNSNPDFHPLPLPRLKLPTPLNLDELLISRSAFWQGAASPFGPRAAWAPPTSTHPHDSPNLSLYPLPPPQYVITNTAANTLSWHPRRHTKPAAGSVVYSRWIPHLGETFSMVALDWRDGAHVDLFHAWQNDPRVSQGWSETGTRAQHEGYLRRVSEEPHRLALLARFDGTAFAYFEVYWAKEDLISAYHPTADYDRGRHSLVGDVRYRGPHRVSAWWSSLMHYLFLDDPRTASVVGEPRYTHSSVLVYDLMHGFGLDKFIDLPGKRAALMSCSRERFFQLCPLDEGEKVLGGTGVGLVPKL